MSETSAQTATVQKLTTPNDQFVRGIFNTQRSYFIDIYQREYKWDERQVKTLLNDISLRFEQSSRHEVDPRKIQQDVFHRFDPYFLNTYLTHTSPTAVSIVDGQQRLTTLLLILIKLYRVLQSIEDGGGAAGQTFRADTLRPLIFEADDFGGAAKFKIFNPNRDECLRALLDGANFTPKDETQKHLQDNYAVISTYFENFLRLSDGDKHYDLCKITYYIAYLLDRVSIVEIRIERLEDVAMIFEVVNDRGLELKPYEILKGKIIGNLIGQEKERANHIWIELQDSYYRTQLRNTKDTRIDLDDFFRVYFRAKFADGETEYEGFEGPYHYELYRRDPIRRYFGEFRDRGVLYSKIAEDIKFFADLYRELRNDYSESREELLYNKLQDQNQQYLLIMSAMKIHDSEKEKKIKTISSKYDQMLVILRLLGLFDSREFQSVVYALNSSLRDKSADECTEIFDKTIISLLQIAGRLEFDYSGGIDGLFTYERFRAMRNDGANFSKYVLMRIDRWLAKTLDKPSYCLDSMQGLEDRFNKTGRKRYGMHLEHIYANNDVNKALFTDVDTGVFDESTFNQQRNLLGMVLLLKDLQNLSSNDDLYVDKLGDYAKSDIIWNQLLAGHLPGIDLRNLPKEFQSAHIPQDSSGAFPRDMIEQRQRIMFEAVKQIWAAF